MKQRNLIIHLDRINWYINIIINAIFIIIRSNIIYSIHSKLKAEAKSSQYNNVT